ncbi:MAG: hypothetical protein U9Q74_05440 [Gemmatimonadota bacterium]|nr:hypothetical protein [Gemmatimonadota bacterium]
MVLEKERRAREDALTAEAIREVGVLLVALAPLDLTFGNVSLRTVVGALFFVLLGLYCFRVGLRMERDSGQAH